MNILNGTFWNLFVYNIVVKPKVYFHGNQFVKNSNFDILQDKSRTSQGLKADS